MATRINIASKNIITLPVVAMRGFVAFPNNQTNFDVGRSQSKNAVEYAVANSSQVFLVAQKDILVDAPLQNDLYTYGVVAEVQQILRISENYAKVLSKCLYRARMIDFHPEGEYYTAELIRSDVKHLKEQEYEPAEAMMRLIRDELTSYMEHFPRLAADIMLNALSITNPARFAEYLAFSLNLPVKDKQAVLDCSETPKRLDILLDSIIQENRVLNIEQDINDKVQESMDQNQREYYLREQMRVISSELGDTVDSVTEADEYRSRIKALPLDDDNKKKLYKEVDRFLQTPSNSQESAVIRSYLDTVLDLPWSAFSEDSYDIKRAEKILNRDHYGLEKVKERILEYLAVKHFSPNPGAQILCLVGPPGVGKTSIAHSIAECIGRKFVRMSLGGVHDESEIRGHRRTYVASMPGRIISAIQQANTSNPVILLDEIDKLGNDYKGDPSSALLEVLDPEQNATFKDNFLDVPYDLSKVMFITTANNASAIPGPLYDRMDVIELASYTREEKLKIAKIHLLKKQMTLYGVSASQFSITDSALYSIIDDYAREAGVRELERKLMTLLRKAIRKIVAGEVESVKITPAVIEEYLGVKLTHGSLVKHTPSVGIVNGLAWTSIGGTVMPIEAVIFKGTGKLEVTGSLGDVMKESVRLAMTNLRLLAPKYSIPDDFFTENDIHVHAPEGAVPKDGPSAGVTLLTALVSAASGIKVKKDITMTGEITLKGDVLPIGGLNEKLIAAYKEKLFTVLIPRDNMPDLAEVTPEVVKKLNIIPVSDVNEVLQYALEDAPKKHSSKSLDAISSPVLLS